MVIRPGSEDEQRTVARIFREFVLLDPFFNLNVLFRPTEQLKQDVIDQLESRWRPWF